MMLFLVGFTIWALFRVSDEIEKFTETTPNPTPVLEPTEFDSEFSDLSLRLENFQTNVLAVEEAVKERRKAKVKAEKKDEEEQEEKREPLPTTELTLSTQDLNLAISALPQFEELRENFHILSLSPERMEIQISYRINRKPYGDSSYRYLNGTIVGKPRLESGQLLIDIEEIHSDKGTVPDGFVDHLSDHQITAPYLKDEVLGPFMKKLTSIELAQNALIVRVEPSKAPPGQPELTIEEIENTKRVALTAFAVVLILVALFLIFFLRWRNTK